MFKIVILNISSCQINYIIIMITLREISDNDTSISSTRWAFAKVINFDIIIIVLSIVAYIVCHLVKRPLDDSFFYAVGTLLGILTTLVATPKALQGFEPREDKCKPNPKEKESDNDRKADNESLENEMR